MSIYKKLCLLAIGLVSMSLQTQAGTPTGISVEMRDGSNLTLLLADSPRITYGEGTIVFSDDKNSVTVDAKQVIKYSPIVDKSSVRSVSVNDLKIRVSGHEVYVTLNEEAPVSVFTVSGQQLLSRELPEGEHLVIGASYPAGVYIITATDKSIKVQKP